MSMCTDTGFPLCLSRAKQENPLFPLRTILKKRMCPVYRTHLFSCNRDQPMKRAIPILLLTLCLSSCASSTPVRHLASDAALIQPGQTTLAELHQYLGEPKDLKLGDRVRITSGPLKGQTGNVKRIKKDRKFVITIGNVAAFTIEGITHDMMEKIEDDNTT